MSIAISPMGKRRLNKARLRRARRGLNARQIAQIRSLVLGLDPDVQRHERKSYRHAGILTAP